MNAHEIYSLKIYFEKEQPKKLWLSHADRLFFIFSSVVYCRFCNAIAQEGQTSVLNYLEGFKNGIVKETFYDVICHHKFVTFYRKVNRCHNLPVEM